MIFDAEQFLFPKRAYAEQLLKRKSRSWEYQQEVRYVVRLRQSSFFKCSSDLVKEVLLRSQFPVTKIARVKNLMAKNRVRAELLKGEPDENLSRINFRAM